MSLLPLLSFAGGELDPILHDNVTLDKFKKGLATARNVIITKTGSIISRFGRQHFVPAKIAGKKIKVYCPKNSFVVMEFGHLYVRIYDLSSFAEYGISQSPFTPSPDADLVTTFTEFDLDFLHFETNKNYVYVFRENAKMAKILLNGSSSAIVPEANVFKVPPAPSAISVVQTGTPTGFPAVQYAITVMINGEESLPIFTSSSYTKPAAAGQSNQVNFTCVTSELITEMRVYSRPFGGGAFGLLGTSTSLVYTSGTTTWTGTLVDYGQFPDYGQGMQELITNYGLNGTAIIELKPKTGVVYQQRLIIGNIISITGVEDNEALIASRPGHHNNFYRDFPYAADSALQFKAGSSGKATVLRIIESDGLVVFTSVGVFINAGLLSVDNLALAKKGGWIIDENLPPLVVPGGVFFVDKTNAIRQLIFSQEIMSYESSEQTIFSNHLFKNRKIISWTFQNGTIPVIIVAFNDGEFATFTYNFEHQMQAWTRHDSQYAIEQVEASDVLDRTVFVTKKGNDRFLEFSLPRRTPIEVQISSWAGQDADKYATTVLMDAMKTKMIRENDIFDVTDHFTLVPVVAGDWSGSLTLSATTGLDFSFFSNGTKWRFFHPVDRSAIDLTKTATSGTSAIVSPSEEFPSEYATSAILYRTLTTITGLSHLEGENVSVVVDGHVVASPLNDEAGYPVLTVTGGSITLPDPGAIIHVGRPIVADVKTLKASTVEQSPTLIESMTANKMYVKVQDTIGLYCSNEFPEEIDEEVDGSSVSGMEDLDVHYVPRNGVLIGNAPKRPASKRLEPTIPGDWQNSGQVSLRQVDPFHFEIISIINDLEIERRSDR
jgi:hypothetical protein